MASSCSVQGLPLSLASLFKQPIHSLTANHSLGLLHPTSHSSSSGTTLIPNLVSIAYVLS